MARTVNSSFVPIPQSHLSVSRPVHEGSDTDEYGELDLIENNNYLLAKHTPTWVRNVFRPEGNGYVVGPGTSYGNASAVFARRPCPDFAEYTITFLATNSGTTSPADDGVVKFELDSSGGNVEVTVAGTTSSTTPAVFSGDLTYDDTQTLDNVEMYIKNGTAGSVRVWSVHIAPKALTSLSAGLMESEAVPMDSVSGDQDAPLSVYHRRLLVDNCETVRKARTGTIVSYADDFTRASAGQFESSSSTYELVAIVPFQTLPGETELEWSVFCHRDASGSGGGVKLITSYMEDEGTSAQEITAGTAWTSPYNGGEQISWSDGGQDTLDVAEATDGHLKVYVKGDGTYKTWLMGLCVWVKEIP